MFSDMPIIYCATNAPEDKLKDPAKAQEIVVAVAKHFNVKEEVFVFHSSNC